MITNQLLGWSQNFITRELVALCDLGVDIRVATRSVDDRSDTTPAQDALAGHAIRLPENPFLPRYLGRHVVFAFCNLAAYARAWRQFFRLKHERVRGRLRSLVCLFRGASVATEVRCFDPDLIHAQFLTAPSETALYLSHLCRKPWSATAHAMDIYRDNSGNQSKIEDALFVTTCTEANRRFLAESNPDHQKKLIRIYHGLARSGEQPSRSRTPRFVFLAVGRMVEKKGFDHLITACDLLHRRTERPFVCRLVGSGPLLPGYRERVRREGLDWLVELPGRAGVEEMGRHYESATALVVPSIVTADGDRDGIPNVCLEAMSYGLPVIASDVSGLPEVVRDGRNGFLVPAGDPAALSRAMLTLMTRDELDRMGAASRRIVAEDFDVLRNMRVFLDVATSYLGDESCVE